MAHRDPTPDALLRNLKGIATRGSEKGPLYDQGVLTVIRQVEETGEFTHNPICGLILAMKDQERMSRHLLTDEERSRGNQYLTERGWSLKQGLEFVAGVEQAEKMLLVYRREEHPAP